MRIIALLIFLIFSNACLSQKYTFSKDSLLYHIQSLQSKGDSFFDDGLFVSQRFAGKKGNYKYDNNIFFTALILYTLQSLRHDFSIKNQQIIDSIAFRARCNYPRYRNRNSDITYNFWQTSPDNSLPNSKFWSNYEKTRLSDDFDDTSIVYLTIENNDSIDVLLKQKMAEYINSSNKRAGSIFKRYRGYKAYNTWFGKKMKQDFDICVMSNTLLFVFQKGQQLNQCDYETIRLINQMVISNDYLNYPQIISPHYRNSTIILYHLSRLLAVVNNENLDSIRKKVIGDIYKKLPQANKSMEKVLLLTSLYRLNEKPGLQIDFKDIPDDFDNFYFFVANPFSGSNILIKKMLGKSEFLCFRYQCEAYYWTLLLELQVLSAKSNI